MKYFNSLPSITTSDFNGNAISLKNILTRATLLPQLQNNPLLFYTYTTQDGDTPETVAYKYYGDQYRYWIVLYGNESLDPQFDWPLSSKQFGDYIINKYTNDAANFYNISNTSINSSQVLAYTQNTIHHYERVIVTTDNTSGTQSIKTLNVTEEEVLSTITGTQKITFNDGSTATQQLYFNYVSIYDYENTLNENKRHIKLINKSYIGAMESQFQTLMSR